jgi:Na+-driven multidrug efflux pump
VPLALLFSRWLDPPVHGFWRAMNTATFLHAILSVVWFSTGRWMRKRV